LTLGGYFPFSRYIPFHIHTIIIMIIIIIIILIIYERLLLPILLVLQTETPDNHKQNANYAMLIKATENDF